MRLAAIVFALGVALVACRHPAAPPMVAQPAMRRLLAPQPIDPNARGAAYLGAVALQLQPGWGQFLDDCRLRLPANHALNQLALAATAELVIDRRGQLVAIDLVSSGNADFDHAVRDAIADATPLAAPPAELLSDDDRLHLHWLFARDRRQAGPATAEIVAFELPLPGVVERLIAAGDLARAARRISTAPASGDRDGAIHRLMIAALHEALGSADGAVRRAAVDAIAHGHVGELTADVRALLTVTSDTELRLTAMAAAATLGDAAAVTTLLHQLAGDLAEHPRLALAETRALVALGHADDVAAMLRTILAADGQTPHAIALQALGMAPVPELAGKLAGWFHHGDARTRAAVCAALGGMSHDAAWPQLAAGLRDGDATVRATCVDSVARHDAGHRPIAALIARLHQLATDRDRAVRAHAIAAIVALDASHLGRAVDDPAPEVRAAFAAALATALPSEAAADLRLLIDDRDGDVRAAAWISLAAAAAAPMDRGQLAARAATDPAPQVRRAAVVALDDDEVLARLAASDDSPEVRTAALVQLAGHRGRAEIAQALLERLAGSPAGGAERVRTALAWLLAR